MSFIDCLAQRAEAGLITQSELKVFQREYNAAFSKFFKSHGDANAAALAARDVAARAVSIAKKKKANALKQIRVNKDLTDRLSKVHADLLEWYNGLSKFSKAMVKKPTLERVVRDHLESVYTRQKSVTRMAFKKASPFIEAYHSNLVGKMDVKGMNDAWRAAGGATDVSAEAMQAGKGLREAFDWLRDQYELQGAIIGKIDNWMPQFHDSFRIKELGDDVDASFEQWYSFIEPKLDAEKMVSKSTGLPFEQGSDEFRKAMRDVFDEIRSDGLSKIAKGVSEGRSMVRGSSFAEKRIDSRFLVFRNIDEQMSYNSRFGSGDKMLFDNAIGYIESISRDIGAMQKMGPSPNSAFGALRLAHELADNKPLSNFSEGMFDVLKGGTLTTGKEGDGYKLLMTTQNVMRSAYLGSAVIPAIGDAVFIASGAKLNGMGVGKAMKSYFAGLSKADKDMIATLGYNHELYDGNLAARFVEDADLVGGSKGGMIDKIQGGTQALSTGVLKVSGLLHLTHRAKNAAMLNFHAHVAGHRKVGWDDLDETFRNSAREHGIEKSDWDVIRKAEVFSDGRGGYLRPDDVAKTNLDVALKYEDWTQTIRHQAVNEPSLRVKTLTTGAFAGKDAGRSGSAQRGFWSSAFMFKGFPLSVLERNMIPAYKRAMTQGDLLPMGIIAFGTTVSGAIALNLVEVAKGNDPIGFDFTDPKFFSAAMVKGGFGGVWGDMLIRDHTTFGRSAMDDLLGPVFQNAGSLVFDTIAANIQKAAAGEETDFSEKLWGDVKRNIPARSLWFWRAAFERVLIESGDRFVDYTTGSDVTDTWSKKEDRLYDMYGQGQWWEHGSYLPHRKPDFDRLLPEVQ